MNAANLEKSDRLQRVAKLLKSGRPYTTLEIVQKANVLAVSAVISELRQQGFDIVCNRLGNVWMYRMQ